MKVLFFGTYDTRKHPHMLVLQEGFRLLGDDVAECNIPLGFTTDERAQMVRQPWRAATLAVRLVRTWMRLRRRARSFRTADAVIVGYMGHFDVHLARRIWPETQIALDHMIFARDTAADRGIGSRPIRALLGTIDAAAIRAADVVCVDTEGHRRMLPSGVRSVVVPRGATTRWFKAPEPLPGGPLRVIFYGSFAPLHGTPVIAEAVARCTGSTTRFTLVGRGPEFLDARRIAGGNPNVEWIDWIEPELLPAVVAGHHVCLGIFGTGDKGRRVVPHKVFEGAAAGCAIVTGDTEPQRLLFGDAAEFVTPGDAAALAGAIGRLSADGKHVQSLREAAHRTAQAAFHPRVIAGTLRNALTSSMHT
jgi:glycosyltransferase involved in cell wall biosynthesis